MGVETFQEIWLFQGAPLIKPPIVCAQVLCTRAREWFSVEEVR
jgi:hypothetical protein